MLSLGRQPQDTGRKKNISRGAATDKRESPLGLSPLRGSILVVSLFPGADAPG
jgi:hypothetical protein